MTDAIQQRIDSFNARVRQNYERNYERIQQNTPASTSIWTDDLLKIRAVPVDITEIRAVVPGSLSTSENEIIKVTYKSNLNDDNLKKLDEKIKKLNEELGKTIDDSTRKEIMAEIEQLQLVKEPKIDLNNPLEVYRLNQAVEYAKTILGDNVNINLTRGDGANEKNFSYDNKLASEALQRTTNPINLNVACQKANRTFSQLNQKIADLRKYLNYMKQHGMKSLNISGKNIEANALNEEIGKIEKYIKKFNIPDGWISANAARDLLKAASDDNRSEEQTKYMESINGSITRMSNLHQALFADNIFEIMDNAHLGDGSVNKDGMKALVGQICLLYQLHGMSKDGAKNLVEGFDVDHNGKWTVEEFKYLVNHYRNFVTSNHN